MTLQLTPIIVGQLPDAPTLKDRPVLGMANTLKPVFRLREALDGVTLRMRFLWMQTPDMWVMGLESDSGAVIRERSQPLTASGVDLWATVRADARMPGGQLWIAWGDQRPRAPGRFDWRENATLYYRPEALVEAVRGTDLELY